MGGLFSKLIASLLNKRLEMVIVGLDNSGKSTLLRSLAGQVNSMTGGDTIPTIGMELKEFSAKGVTMKCWDLGGQVKFRGQWQRYAKGCDVIIYVVDCSDFDRVIEAKRELNTLLEEESLRQLPLLVVANKIDIEPHLGKMELIKALNLDYISEVPWTVVAISAKFQTNLVEVLQWLVAQSKRPSSS